MKFDAKTLEVLKNYSTINPSIKFSKGNVIKTVSPNKTILSKANVTSDIEGEFCIGELNRFMSALSLFSEPEIVLGEKKCEITDGKNRLEYVYTAEELVKLPPEKDIKVPSEDIKFSLTNEMLQGVRKAMSVLSLSEMAIVGKDGKLIVKAYDSSGTTKDNYAIEVGTTESNFIVVFKAENLKLMPYDYEVVISKKGLSWFKNPAIEYWVTIEAATSEFE